MQLISHAESGLEPSTSEHYVSLYRMPDGQLAGVHRLMFHWTAHIGVSELGYEDRYCFATREMADKAMTEWSGEGDPDYWHKHPRTGRRRDPETGEIWHESDKRPERVIS